MLAAVRCRLALHVVARLRCARVMGAVPHCCGGLGEFYAQSSPEQTQTCHSRNQRQKRTGLSLPAASDVTIVFAPIKQPCLGAERSQQLQGVSSKRWYGACRPRIRLFQVFHCKYIRPIQLLLNPLFLGAILGRSDRAASPVYCTAL